MPWLVALWAGARRARLGAQRVWVPWFALLAFGLAAVLVPRLGLAVASSEQSLDPFNRPETLSKLWTTPANGAHLLRVFLACATYWLPTLLLATRARRDSARRGLAEHPGDLGGQLALYLGLHFLLVLYGGVNVGVFAAYAVAAQVAVLALLLREHPPRAAEAFAVLAVLAVFHRVWVPIPDPRVDETAYLDFHHLRRGVVAWGRLGELGLVLAGTLAVRLALGRAGAVAPRGLS